MADTVLVQQIMAALHAKFPTVFGTEDVLGGMSCMFDTVRGPLIDAGDADDDVPNKKGGTSTIAFTTGATQRTCTFGTLEANEGHQVTVFNGNGSGAGGVKLVANGTEKFLYDGYEFSNLYLRLPGRRVTVFAIVGVGWLVVSGEVSPVDNEPDLGGGWHSPNRSVSTWDANINDTTTTPYVWDISAIAPYGHLVSVLARLFYTGKDALAYSAGYMWDYDEGSYATFGTYNVIRDGLYIGRAYHPAPAASQSFGLCIESNVKVGASRKLYMGNSTASNDFQTILKRYKLGPA